MMKRIVLVVSMLFAVCLVKAQDVVDDFNVGPYEVYYKGQGDVNFRLKKGVDLYEYFGLQRDTVIQYTRPKPEPFIHGVQLSIFGDAVVCRSARNSMVYGIEASWKQRIAKMTYFNGGVSLGYAPAINSTSVFDLLEVGIPLSIEISNMNKNKASLYASLGVSPSYYYTISPKSAKEESIDPSKNNGWYVAPRLELGGYIPVGQQIVKIGVHCKYKINCSGQEYDVHAKAIGKGFVGASIGIIF